MRRDVGVFIVSGYRAVIDQVEGSLIEERLLADEAHAATNHHVATGDPKSPPLKNISFRVRLDDGTEKNAELIAVDDKADIALMMSSLWV